MWDGSGPQKLPVLLLSRPHASWFKLQATGKRAAGAGRGSGRCGLRGWAGPPGRLRPKAQLRRRNGAGHGTLPRRRPWGRPDRRCRTERVGPVARGAGAWSGSCTWRSDWWGFSWRNCPSHVSVAARRRRQAARLHRRSPDDAPPRGIRNRHAWRPSARASRQRPAACQSPFAGCVPRAACRVSPRASAAAGSLAWRAPRGAVGRRVLSIPARPASARCALGPSGRGLQAVAAAAPTDDYSLADGSAPSGPGRQAASGTAGDRPVIRDRWPLIAPGAR